MIQQTFADASPEYAAFLDKFKPKKTTDDCYTPAPVYAAGVLRRVAPLLQLGGRQLAFAGIQP